MHAFPLFCCCDSMSTVNALVLYPAAGAVGDTPLPPRFPRFPSTPSRFFIFWQAAAKESKRGKLGLCKSLLCLNHFVLFLPFSQSNSGTFALRLSPPVLFPQCSHRFPCFSSSLSSALTICPLNVVKWAQLITWRLFFFFFCVCWWSRFYHQKRFACASRIFFMPKL